MDDETLGASTTPSLVYAGAFAASEALFLGGAVLVLGVALLMLAGMFPALSTPSKTMVVMLAANLGGALVSLLQALYLLVFLARGRYLEQARLQEQVVTWWGQLLLAWTTWRIIRGGKRVGRRMLAWRMFGVSAIVGSLILVGMEIQAPGQVLWGLFCVTPMMMPSDALLDVRFAAALLCDVTLALCCLLYGASYWRLRRMGHALSRRSEQQQRSQHGQQGQEEGNEGPSPSQARRLHQASRVLWQRSMLLLVAYYVPYILVHIGIAKLKMDGHSVHANAGPQSLQMSLFFLGCVFGQPVLQSLVFIYAAATIGNNLLGASVLLRWRGEGEKQGNNKKGRKRRRREGRLESEPPTPSEGAGAAASVVTASLPPNQQQEQDQQQPAPALLLVQSPAVGPMAGGGGHAHLSRGRRRTVVSVQGRQAAAAKARERLPVLATVYEVTFRKGRWAAARQAAAGQVTAPGSLQRATPPISEEASLMGENLGSSEEDEHDDEYDTEEEGESEESGGVIRYEEEEEDEERGSFDDAGRSVVFDPEEEEGGGDDDEEMAQMRGS